MGISAGHPTDLVNASSLPSFVHGFRSVLPWLAGFLSLFIICYKLVYSRGKGIGFFSPLGLAAGYGLIGLAAVSVSLDSMVALRWSTLYLTVPIVLWGMILWSTDGIDLLHKVFNVTWFVAILVTGVLFFTAIVYLDLLDIFKDPLKILECPSGNWFDLTSGRLRDTGVGRYAAIASIIAICGIIRKNWWPLWLLILSISLVLLMFSGARGSLAGFGISLIVIVIISFKKRILIWLIVGTLLISPIVWLTNTPSMFIEKCILRDLPFWVTGVEHNMVSVTNIEPSSDFEVGTGLPSKSLAADGVDELVGVTTTAGLDKISSMSDQIGVETLEATRAAETGTTSETGTTAITSDSSGNVVVPDIPSLKLSDDGLIVSRDSQHQDELNDLQKVNVQPVNHFLLLTGRTPVWEQAILLTISSPFLGHGVHADRLLLNTHVHNSFVHAFLQTGLVGGFLFTASIVFAWVLAIKNYRDRNLLSSKQLQFLIIIIGMLAFLTVRALPESTGAFFGVDWLILAPIYIYLQLLRRRCNTSRMI